MIYRINFFAENIQYVVRKKNQLRKWVVNTVEEEGKVPGDINFILCDDGYLSKLNYKYLKHKTLTDIITFPFIDEKNVLCGDIFISLPRVKENSKKFSEKLNEELHRVMIHGVLHLCGYKDSSEDEKKEMRAREDFYLARLNS